MRRAVNFAAAHDLLTAVRGGGHSQSGQSGCNGGIVIDLSADTRRGGRPDRPGGARRGRCSARPARPRSARLWARNSRRHRGRHRSRGTHPGGRCWAHRPQVRADLRQPPGSGARDRGWPLAPGERAGESGSALGATGRRRQLRRRHDVRVSAPRSQPDRVRRDAQISICRCARGAPRLRGLHRRGAR